MTGSKDIGQESAALRGVFRELGANAPGGVTENSGVSEDEARDETRALVPAVPASRLFHGEALTTLSNWAKSVWPAWGWRQPA
jgi:hypothetical protein